MSILSPQEHAALHAYIAANPGLSDQQVFDAIHAPTAVANSANQRTVNVPFNAASMILAIAAASAKFIRDSPEFESIRALLEAPEPKPDASIATLVNWAAAFAHTGDLSPTDFAKLCGNAPVPGVTWPQGTVDGMFAVREPDPAWTPTIPGPSWAATNLGAFGSKTWTDPDGSAHNFITPAAIAEARS